MKAMKAMKIKFYLSMVLVSI